MRACHEQVGGQVLFEESVGEDGKEGAAHVEGSQDEALVHALVGETTD